MRMVTLLHPGIETAAPEGAPRAPGTVSGRIAGGSLGVIDSGKFGFDRMTAAIAAKLRERAGLQGYVPVRKPHLAQVVADEQLDDLLSKTNFVITGLGD